MITISEWTTWTLGIKEWFGTSNLDKLDHISLWPFKKHTVYNGSHVNCANGKCDQFLSVKTLNGAYCNSEYKKKSNKNV